MGLDAGGGGGRCLLLDADSGACSSAFRAWSHPIAPDTGGLGYDLDCDVVEAHLAEAVREALAAADARPDEVVGIAATSMRFAMVVVDAEGRPVYAGPNRDARAAGEGIMLGIEHGEALHALSGHWPVPIMPAPRLQWMAKQPDLAARAHTFLALSDWVAFRLCGETASDPTQAGGSALFDLRAGTWSDTWIETLGLPRSLFPRVVSAGTRLGTLTDDAAARFGLPAGIPVAVGGGDTQCGLAGSGAVTAGTVGLVAGTSAPVQRVEAEPRIDPDGRLWSGAHVARGRFVVESNAGAVGESIDWLAHVMFPSAAQPAARLLAEADASEPGARGMLSWVGAHIFNAREMSLPIGSLAFSHLAAGQATARRHLLRAVVEGNAFGLRANLEQVEAVGGPAQGPLRLSGGLTRSPFFAQLIADVCGRLVSVAPHPEATALGAALCAGVGAGVFEDVAEAAASLASNGRTLEPDRELSERYSEIYTTWREAHDLRGEIDTKLRAHAMPAVLNKEDAAPARAPVAAVRPRILVTADLDAASLAALERLGEVEYAPFRKKMRLLTGDTLVTALAGVNVLMAEVDVVDGASMAKLPDLRVVATCRGDAVNVDVEAATLLGIPVLNAPGRNADAVADLAVAFMLMLSRKLGPANDFLRQPGEAGDMGRMGKAFGTLRGRELWRKTVGLVGLGAVGRKVAERLEGFGARVLVADPFVSDAEVLRAGAEPADLATLLAQSDFVSLHAPVNDATRGLIGAAELAALKPGACLVNTARAALVDHDALLQALADGRLGGAALDVFPVEPPGSDDPLLAFDNVVATPHVGGNTEDVAAHQGEIVVADLERLLRGERPKHLLNPEIFEAFDWSRPRPEPDAEALARVTAGPGPAVTDLQKDSKKKAGSGARAATPPAPEAAHAVPASLAPVGDAARTAQTMAGIVADFVERIATSGALDRFAPGRDVTLHFNLSDLNEAFWLRVREGAVTAGRGAPDAEAEVQLRLSADVFDGMFTNRLNPMQAAMEGRISFSGDTAKAMSLQEFQGDLSNLYQQARERIGDPGDLTALSTGPSGAPPPVTHGDPRVELVQVVGELYAQQLITATGGNVSVRIPGSEQLWITPSQLFKGDLAPEVLVRIDLDGHNLDEGTRSASSESLMHGAVYQNRPDAGAVIHAHAPNATILVNSDLPFLPVSTEAAFFGNIPRIPFIMPGTRELADAVGVGIRQEWAVLMKNHGLLVAGRSLRRAADMAEIIERSCEIILGCRAQGVEPPVLPDDIVETLRKMGDLVA